MFSFFRIKDRQNLESVEKTHDIEEGKTLKEQFESYCQTKQQIEKQHREKKVALKEFYKSEINLKKVNDIFCLVILLFLSVV